MFRRAALDHRSGGEQGKEGDVLRIETRWTTWSVRVVIAGILTAIAFCLVCDVSEYASGTAVVRVEGRRPLVTTLNGIVDAVYAQPGQHVEKDQVLLTLSAALEEAEHRRATTEFQLALASLLRDPSDHDAKVNLQSLKPKRDVAAQIAAARGRTCRRTRSSSGSRPRTRPSRSSA